jgi:hypothetical protein
MKTARPQPDRQTKIALTIAALAYSNCLYLATQPDLTPPQTALLEISIVILEESTRTALKDNDKDDDNKP